MPIHPNLEQKKIIGGSFNVYESAPETEITVSKIGDKNQTANGETNNFGTEKFLVLVVWLIIIYKWRICIKSYTL